MIPDFISEGGSDINPRRLTPSSGETFMDSNSEDGEDFHTQHIEIKGSNSFYNKRHESNAIFYFLMHTTLTGIVIACFLTELEWQLKFYLCFLNSHRK